jgi:VIT1/CCC1 family predicted Fe2+/Mn2+ transporter
MGLLARLSRIVPLILLLALLAGILYLVITYRHSPARAKEVLIKVFTVLCSVISGFFALASVYAYFDNAWAVLDLTISFLIVGLIGLGITRLCNRRFIKNNPHYKFRLK